MPEAKAVSAAAPGVYRAFLSYSHADKEIAHKLHSWLEAFRIPAGLPGAGELLRPIFLDEAELGAAPLLGERLHAALDASQALVLVASPTSAQSPWVADEVLHFRSTKPHAPCLAIIVAGHPFASDEAQECFPKPLKYKVRDDKVTDERSDPLAPDVSKHGEEGAFLRLAAGLIGVNFSDLFDRHAAREAATIKRQRRALAKAYTIPASDAASAGHQERVLKYMLAYALEADDAEWREAPELEALAHDAARALPCKSVLRTDGTFITQALYSPDGRIAATVLSTRQCVLWEAEEGQAIAILGDRKSSILQAAFSPDGAKLLTGSGDGAADLWDVPAAAHVVRFDGLTGSVKHVQFCGDGTLVAAATEDQCRLWDLRSRAVAGGVPNFGVPTDLIAISPDGWTLATAGDAFASGDEAKRRVTLWDLRSGGPTLKLAAHSGSITCLGFSPDGRRLVTGADDQLALVWDAGSGEVVLTLMVHGDPQLTRQLAIAIQTHADNTDALLLAAHAARITDAAFSPDDSRIVTASADKTACVWDACTGAMVARFAGHTAALSSACFSPDGAKVVTTAFNPFPGNESDPIVRVWHSRSGAELHRLVGHEGAVFGAVFDGAGERILSYGADFTARTWTAAPPHMLLQLTGHKGQVLDAAFDASGARVLSRSIDGEVRLWDAHTGDTLVAFNAAKCRTACFSPSGREIAIGARDGSLRVFDAATGGERSALSAAAANIDDLVFGTDGTQMAFTALDGAELVVRVADLKSRTLIGLAGHSGGAAHLRFARDGSRLIASDDSESIIVWDLKTGQFSRWPTGHSGRILDLALSPDGARLGVASGDRHASVFDLNTGALVFNLRGHLRSLHSIAFSPDGSRAATASDDGTAIVWDLANGTQVMRVRHQAEVRSARFDGTGRRLITASKDNTARIWDAETGRQLASLTGHGTVTGKVDHIPGNSDPAFGLAVSSLLTMIGVRSAVTRAEFSPDGRRALTASLDGIVRIWDVSDTMLRGGELTAWICNRMKSGVAGLAGADLSDVLLRDVLPRDQSRDLARAVMARWPHLN